MSKPQIEAVWVDGGNGPALALMAQLHREAFTAQGEKAWTTQSFQQLLLSPGFEASLYTSEDTPIGFTLVRTVLDEAELISMAVAPFAQGKGVAKHMLNQMIEGLKAKKVDKFFLEVRQDNAKAIQLYQQAGFRKISERKDYYQTTSGKNIDAFVFSLSLEQ